jgi:hypothetical protein
VSGGGASDVLDCVLQISFMVFSAKKRLSSNVRFIRESDVKGFFINLYPPRVRI